MKANYFLLLILSATFLNAQISLKINELDAKLHSYLLPNNSESQSNEIRHPGHFLEATLENNSDQEIWLPIDTISYAIPYNANPKIVYSKFGHYPPDPDLANNLGVYGFIYQNKKFIDGDRGTDPNWEIWQYDELAKNRNKRQEKINKHKKEKEIIKDEDAIYNYYLNENMVCLKPKNKLNFKFYFNPFLKVLDLYRYREYYFHLNHKSAYSVNFKIILNKNIYKFLTAEDKKHYPNLFKGIITSNTLEFQKE